MPWLILIGLILLVMVGFYLFQRSTTIVPEDHQAVVVDGQGFVKRVISAGPHHLKPWREKIEFTFETKTKLVQGTAADVPTAEGILLTVHWSGTYRPNTALITENVSQRLRSLPKAETGIQRKVDVVLRRLLGAYTLRELFRPVIRERIERQLTEAIKSQLSTSGIVLNGIDLQAIIPPTEVLHALNQAQAIQTLDGAIRASDTATRDMVAGSHQLEELIEWSKLFPPYGRYALAHPTQAQ